MAPGVTRSQTNKKKQKKHKHKLIIIYNIYYNSTTVSIYLCTKPRLLSFCSAVLRGNTER
jgi:hypothetical protein